MTAAVSRLAEIAAKAAYGFVLPNDTERIAADAEGEALADEYRRTQSGNSDILVEHHGRNFRFVERWNSFIVWNNHRWCLDKKLVWLSEKAKDVGKWWLSEAVKATNGKERETRIAWHRFSLTAPSIRAMIELARGIEGVVVDHESLDADPWLFGVRNGVIDLRTGQYRASSRDDLMMMQAPVKYDAQATAPRWTQALEEWFPDEKVRLYVQCLAGSALVGTQRDHVFVIHFGGGRNGKGTFVRALKKVFGQYSTVAHMSLLTQQRHAEHDTVKADLFRARLAIASESEKRVSLAEASVKNLTGADRIKCRRLFEDSWEFDPSHSLWLLTNHLPEIQGRDLGIWTRIRVVKWEKSFIANPDVDLDAKLADEAPGILNWLIEGCRMWRARGLKEPEAVVRETLAYRKAEDVLGRFAAECGVQFTKDITITADELNNVFDSWAISEGAKVSKKDLGLWLTDHGARKDRRTLNGKKKVFWAGVGIDV